ncbi:MAG: lytic murein transglycosylase [Rhodospirillaceae bacterium]
MRRFLIAAVLATSFSTPVLAQNAEESGREFGEWLDGVRTEALERGIKPAIVEEALSGVTLNPRLIQRDRNQAEFKLTLERYRNNVVTPTNIDVGRRMADQHRDLLAEVSRRYGVQPRFILAIWGIETRYGAVKADVPLIQSLATLAFDRRRSKFFRGQLFSALEIADRGYMDVGNLFGSWAGAMGQPQFMPSSYLAYAVDFDGDGRRDIWNNLGDVFGSIANYLAKHGWSDDLTWGRPVMVPEAVAANLGTPERNAAPGCRAKTHAEKPLSEWHRTGLRRTDGGDLPARDIPAALVRPDAGSTEHYLVYRNYSAIMAYNCAHLYAVTVGTLADRISGQ